MEFLADTNFGLFVMIIAPGFISLKIWGLLHPSRSVSFANSLYEAIFYGVLNYFAIVQWLPPLLAKINIVIEILAYIVSLAGLPILWPILWNKILVLIAKKQKIINPIPKAWDVFFMKRKACFMIVHLKNGQAVGGLYAGDSAASSYPEKADLYLEQIWKLDNEGKFIEPIKGTMGLMVDCDNVEYIELFHYVEKGV
jgi:hypothetical protein